MRRLPKASVSRRQRMAFSERHPDVIPTGKTIKRYFNLVTSLRSSKEMVAHTPCKYANGVPQ